MGISGTGIIQATCPSFHVTNKVKALK